MATVVFVATYDTKGVESDYVKRRVEAYGAKCLTIDVGVGGKPEGWDLADYVLGTLKGNDGKRMEEAFRTAADAAELLITEGGAAAMNRYNTKPKKPGKKEEPVKKEEP